MAAITPQTKRIIDSHNITLATQSIPVDASVAYFTSSAVIHASPEEVWEALTNTSTWPTWNSFCPSATIRSQPSHGEYEDKDKHKQVNDKITSTCAISVSNSSSSSSSLKHSENTSSSSNNDHESESSSISPHLIKNTKAIFHMNMNPSRTRSKRDPKLTFIPLVITEYIPPSLPLSSGPRISQSQTPSRIAWSIDRTAPGIQPPKWLYHIERVYELHSTPATTTKPETPVVEVISWEASRGLLAHIFKLFMAKKIVGNVQLQADELKEFVEERRRRKTPV